MEEKNNNGVTPTEFRAKTQQPTQCRKWQLAIMNPMEKAEYKEFWTNPQKLLDYIKVCYPKLNYACISLEHGLEEGHIEHIHIFLYSLEFIRKSSFKTHFPSVHYEACKGTCEENRNYVFKIGKWELTEKVKERIEGMQFEIGEMPTERQGKRNDLETLYAYIKEGKTNAEIYAISPAYMKYANSLDRIRQDIIRDKSKKQWRDIDVTYVWGVSGTGKTRTIMETHGYENVYRTTDYTHPFDGYTCQDVIDFEEFRSDLRISDMLQILDGYPVELGARYNNKQACFTKAYITTNIDLWDQYKNKQEDAWETFKAFVRRIKKIKVYHSKTDIKEYSIVDYILQSPYSSAKMYDLLETVAPDCDFLKTWKLDEDGKGFIPKEEPYEQMTIFNFIKD